MMKKITNVFLVAAMMLLFGNVAKAQATIDFETVGQSWAWTLFENGDNAPELYSIVGNPSATGINTSANCAKYVVNAAGQPWAGLWSNDLGAVTFTADNCIVKVMVYKDVISKFDVKFENADASVNFEKLVSNTKVNEWEELTFDFTSQIGKSVSRLVIIPDFPTARTAGSVNYWDNITFNAGAATEIKVPTIGAPVPPAIDPASVISIFSNSFDNVPNTNFSAAWGQSTALSIIDIAGNSTLKLDNLNYQGFELESHLNASAMDVLHVDVWSPNETSLEITPISPGQEFLVKLEPLKLNEWNSFEIPLSSFTGVAMNDIFQFKIVGAGGNIVYIDNLVFHKKMDTPPTTTPTIDFEKVGQDWSWTLFENGDNAPTLYSVVANPSTTGMNSSPSCAKYVVNAGGQPWAGLWSSNLGNLTFTADNCKVKVMVYKDVISNFDVKFENADASVAFEKQVSNTVTNQWEELHFDFTNQIGKSVSKLVIIPDFPTARTSGSVNYFDNISFNSQFAGIENATMDANIRVFPNPVQAQLQVKSDNMMKSIIITDLAGKMVKNESVNNTDAKIDIRQFAQGNYIISIQHQNGLVVNKKFVKL
ncbi:MAG: T9SS type A sorting domain-containing protein [Bacteroidales bacterium]|nr:T9SS type A sorting domain-containing protein [Bacteroidales bacterium]